MHAFNPSAINSPY